MNGMPQTPGAGMFPAGAQPIPTNGATPQLTNAIAQVESNGNPNAVGAAGELGSMQALPSTMKDPGFGVKPAQDNTPAEADRVGRDYYSAMKGRYNDPILAAAAYNAGPGRMDAAIARSQKEGGHPMQYMPDSTQQYVAKFAQKINYQPGQTAEQNPNIDRPWDNPAEGLHLPGQETHRFVNMVNEAKGNPEQLHKIMYDPATPPGVARAAQDDVLDHLTQIRQVDQANQTIQKMATGDPRATNDFVRETKKPAEEGSILKAIFYARMGLTGMAQEEQQKLLGQQLTTTTGMMDGQHYTLRTDNRGNIQRAYDAEGRAVDDKTLAGLQANALALKGATTSATTGYDKNNNVINKIIRPGQPVQYYDATNQKYLDRAPEGYREGKDQKEILADTAFKQSLAADEAENRKQFAATGTNLYTEEQKQERAHNKRNSILNLGAGAEPTSTSTSTTLPANTPSGANLPENTGVQAGIRQEALDRYEGRLPPLGGIGASNRRGQAVQTEIAKLEQERGPMNGGDYKRINKNKEAWDTGKQGQQVQQFDRASAHALSMGPVIDNLNNTRSPQWNAVKTEFERATGSAAPVDFDMAKQIVGDEIIKTVLGGNSAKTDREGLQSMFSRANTPGQLKAVLNRARELMGAQGTAMERQYQTDTRQHDFSSRVGPAGQQILNQGRESDRAIANQNIKANMPSQEAIDAEMRKRGLK